MNNQNESHERIEEYNPEWVCIFESESQRIKEIMGDTILEIEHIGSTSIPGLCGKPIVDIGVLVNNKNEVGQFLEQLAETGYAIDEKNPSTERHFFRKGNPTTSHLSIAYKDAGSFWERQILFRDYLRGHNEARDEYASLKKELMQKDPTGKDVYIGGKTEFVTRVLREAGFEGVHIS